MRSIILTAAFLTLGLFTGVSAQTNGVRFFGHLDLPHGGEYSGGWGYTHPNGREYALTGCYTGTSIVDITDSTNIHEVAFIPGPSSLWHEIRTWDHYAYVVSEGGGGTQIIDLSGLPGSATLVTSYTYTSGINNTAKAHSLEIFDGYLYLNGCANWSPGGVVIFSLANPVAPVYQGVYTQRYIHDSYVRNDTLYGAAIYSGGGIDIINVQNKTNPVLIGRITYTGSGTHNVWTTKDRHYVISTDEIGGTAKTLKFWDLTTFPPAPTNPVSTYTINPADIEHNVVVRGNYAYVAWYTAGIVVVDISDPTNPQTAGYYDTYPGPSGGYNGVWPIYPSFPSGKITATDMQTGTWVFRFDGLAPRRPVSLLQPANGDSLFSPHFITFRWTATADRNADPHYFQLRIMGPGLDTAIRANDTTITMLTNTLPFQQNSTYNWTVITRDEVSWVASADTFQFVFNPTVTGVLSSIKKTNSYKLEANFPNPFNPTTTITYALPQAGHVSLRVFDVLGEEVAILVNTEETAGLHTVEFAASSLASGMYFYRLETPGFRQTRKMVVIK